MKTYLLILSVFFLASANATYLPDCGPNLVRVWTGTGMSCVSRMTPTMIGGCFPSGPNFPNTLQQNFPFPIYQPQAQPWWATQGNFYYPNLQYPGPWSYPGIQSRHYPGQGEVFAAKPNVYIESIHEEAKFDFKFTSSERPHFLATTPILNEQSWSGKIKQKDKFEVDGINYDYLFYDVRLPKKKMQFTHGVCATREDAIEWMLLDLKEMNYPLISLQDFEEHWRVKIPDYPYYCIYPQYNRDLDSVLPVEISLNQSTFIRSLYVLFPHKKEPDMNDPQEISLPQKDPKEFRPKAKIQRENMFREWGVAFLGY